jgi:DNA-binding IclR family transcriptional regulator
MPRQSPPTERVVRILRNLADADEPATLSTLARELRLNMSTCQTILQTLGDAGFVVRSAVDKTYTLGPALISLGDAARALTPLLARARAVVEELHAEIGYHATILMPSRDELVVVHRTGAPDEYPVPAMALGPFPFVEPVGATIVADADAATQEAWLERVADEASELRRYRALLRTIRTNGWCAWSYSSATEALLPQFERLLRGLARDTHAPAGAQQVIHLLSLAESRGLLTRDLARSERLSVTMITLPARLPTTPLELDVYVYERDLPTAKLHQLAEAARRAAEAITRMGDEPGAPPPRRGRRTEGPPVTARR